MTRWGNGRRRIRTVPDQAALRAFSSCPLPQPLPRSVRAGYTKNLVADNTGGDIKSQARRSDKSMRGYSRSKH